MFGKPCLQSAKRPPRAHADHDGINLSVELLIQLRRGGRRVRQRIGGVIELINVKRAGERFRQPLGVVLIVGWVAFANVRTGQHHLSAKGTEVENLLPAHFVRHNKDKLVPALGGDQSQPKPGVARGGFDNGTARQQQPLLLRLVDHRQRHPIFDGAAGVLIFQLQKQVTRAGIQLMQLQYRRLADQLGDGMVNGHTLSS